MASPSKPSMISANASGLPVAFSLSTTTSI
jgi:hypothetical protein